VFQAERRTRALSGLGQAARRDLPLSPWAGFALGALWAIGTAACTLARRGELLEVALVGAAGAVAWTIVRGARLTLSRAALLTLAFLAPLLNTWPVRVFDSARVSFGFTLWALSGIPSLLVLVAALTHRRWSVRLPRLLLLSIAVVTLAAVASSLASDRPTSAAAGSWVALVVPALFGLLLAQSLPSRTEAERYVGVAVLAGAVPALIGIAAYLLEFGFPTSGSELVEVKALLYRPHFFQEATFGNVDHLADFALVLLGPALAVALSRAPRAVRAGAGVAAAAFAAVLILVLSRSALLLGAVECLALGVAFAVGGSRRRAGALPAAVGVVLIAIALTPSVSGSIAKLLPPTLSHSTTTAATSSESVRVSAIRTGLRIFEDHAPWGVGTAQYPRYDPVHTAPHSLAVQLLAENGVLGLAGLALLALFLLDRTTRLILSRRQRDAEPVVPLGCAAGALALLAEGAVAGVPLSIGPVSVWALLLWLLVGVLGIDEEAIDDSS
jgi:O-antigen ligase